MKYDPEKHHRRSIRLQNFDYSRCGAYFVTICTQNRICLFGDIEHRAMYLNDAGNAITLACQNLPTFCSGLEIDTFVVMPNHVHIIFILTRNDVGAGLRACPVNDDCALTRNESGAGLRACPVDDDCALTRNESGAGLRACPVNDDCADDRSFITIDRFEPKWGHPRREGHPRRGAPTTENGRTSLSDVVYKFKSWTTKRYAEGVKHEGWTAFPGRLWQRNYYERVIRSDIELARFREYIESNPRTWDDDEENANRTGSNQMPPAGS